LPSHIKRENPLPPSRDGKSSSRTKFKNRKIAGWKSCSQPLTLFLKPFHLTRTRLMLKLL